MLTKRTRKNRQVIVALDFKKAFDSIKRSTLFKRLYQRAKNPEEAHITKLLVNLFDESEYFIGDEKVTAN